MAKYKIFNKTFCDLTFECYTIIENKNFLVKRIYDVTENFMTVILHLHRWLKVKFQFMKLILKFYKYLQICIIS